MQRVTYLTSLSSESLLVDPNNHECKLYCATTVEGLQDRNDSLALKARCARLHITCTLRFLTKKKHFVLMANNNTVSCYF